MNFGVQQALGFRQWELREFPRDLSDYRHSNADEHVAFTVLARAGLEEASRNGSDFGAPQAAQACSGFTC
jgi:hypothetical protein